MCYLKSRVMGRLLPLFVLFILGACGPVQNKVETAAELDSTKSVEVLYFHGKQRCVTCRAIGTLTKSVVDTTFAEAQKLGKIAYRAIDVSMKENKAIAEKYEVVWSALILDRGGKVVDLTDMGFTYAKGQPDVFKTKLKDEITKLLQ